MAQVWLQPPDSFNFKDPEIWWWWRCQYSGLKREDAGEEADSIMASINATEKNWQDYSRALRKFDAFMKVLKNVIFEPVQINLFAQLTSETREHYIS